LAGVYIHIPFCRQKCNYCNFFSLASKSHISDFVAALIQEVDLRKEYLNGESINTLYFGGGTPSLLDSGAIGALIEKIDSTFPVSPVAEITLEANPDDLNPKKLRELKSVGINRVSIGVQSFRDADLLYLNRTHSGAQAETCIKQALGAGFENLSIDLIYGIPFLGDEEWEKNIGKAVSMNIPHISAYALTVEEKTPLEWLIRQGKLPAVEEEKSAKQFGIGMRTLADAGYEHYEISNFCKPGSYSKHNTAYWQGEKYIGFGPSAHSFDGHSRQWNVANLHKYIESVKNGSPMFEKEELTKEQEFNEYIMISLRTMWGCDLDHLRKKFGLIWTEKTLDSINKFKDQNLVEIIDDHILLKDHGKLFADRIASELFRV
jgi:putative oxygen-independent coproporphyrinogen III oxidase